MAKLRVGHEERKRRESRELPIENGSFSDGWRFCRSKEELKRWSIGQNLIEGGLKKVRVVGKVEERKKMKKKMDVRIEKRWKEKKIFFFF